MKLTVARFGDQPLLVTRFSDEGVGRDWNTLSPSRGDEHSLQERGRRQRRTRCELLFTYQPGEGPDAYLDRWLAFRALAESTAPRLFTHPTDGAYLAIVFEASMTVEAQRRCVSATCTFVAAEEPQAVFPLGAGVTPNAGPEQVGVLATTADAELAAQGLSSSAPAAAVATATTWSEVEEPDPRSIAIEAASVIAGIDNEVERLQLLADLTRWPAYRALIRLRYSVSLAAAAATSETTQALRFVVQTAEPLRAMCARLFGASEAEERARQVQKLNGLRTPGMVPAGTTLALPAVRRR